jgi:acetylornithine deacetylase/succinyl-diaminopimelate desuccinylase-like protein
MDAATAAAHVDEAWSSHIVDTLQEYIRIPNVSPAYDAGWAEAGHMDRAAGLLRDWCQRQVDDGLRDATVTIQELPGRTPLLVIDVPPSGGPDGTATPAGTSTTTATPTDGDTVLLYGHLDKQPPFDGWRPGLGPWEPVIDGDRLYGRGGGDDGYSVFAALTAIAAIRAAGGAHARCLVLVEASEESGSPDLAAHLDQLGDRVGSPSLVVCLDAGCGDYHRLWYTTSLRGLVDLVLRVEVLTEGVHSGRAGGIVPSSFRIMRHLLDRIEDAETGDLLPPELRVTVPELRRTQAAETAALLGHPGDEFRYMDGGGSIGGSPEDLLLARTWEPALEVTGLDGAPVPALAGNVLRPFTEAKLSFRLPPTADARAAADALVKRLTEDPPYGASVTATLGPAEDGWHAPPEPEWLQRALDGASTAAFGHPARAVGEGGSIPFMGMLGRAFPDARFVITGVLGPGSNAHGPNEYLHLPTARRVTTAVAHILDAHARR